jgi:hypothetical protein
MAEHDIICMAIFLTSPTFFTPFFGFNMEMESTWEDNYGGHSISISWFFTPWDLKLIIGSALVCWMVRPKELGIFQNKGSLPKAIAGGEPLSQECLILRGLSSVDLDN